MRCLPSKIVGVGLAGLLVACSGPPDVTNPDLDPVSSFEVSGTSSADHHDPGHGRGGGGGGPDGGSGGGEDQAITIDVSGSSPGTGIIAVAQPAIIDRDTPSALKILGGSDNIGTVFTDELALSSLAGSPTPDNLGNCEVDPADAPREVVQRVIDRLDDSPQPRDRFIVAIEKKKLGSPGSGALTHNWTDDGDGFPYRTWIQEATVAEVAPDEFEFSGGTIKSWDNGDANTFVFCPNLGTIKIKIIR